VGIEAERQRQNERKSRFGALTTEEFSGITVSHCIDAADHKEYNLRAYLPEISARPGCPCCTNKFGHSFTGMRASESMKRTNRAGKKSVRAAGKKTIKEQVDNAE
jgi:hypothetical protein